MKYLPIILAICTANAWACPQFSGDQFYCTGEDAESIAEISISGSTMKFGPTSLQLNGTPQPGPIGQVIRGTCVGNVLNMEETLAGITAKSTLTLTGNTLVLSGQAIVTECRADGASNCVGNISAGLGSVSANCQRK